jgi:UDP-N-acetylmuramate dehydrogenase
MQKIEQYSLKHLNTFNIDVNAKLFVEVFSLDDICKLVEDEYFQNNSKLFIGGGSNILFSKDFDGIVVKLSNKGIELIDEDNDFVYVKAQAGEVWDDFVEYCVNQNWAGLENLSLIPGQIGASPIQNIGAYGVELKDVFHTLSAINIKTGTTKEFTKDDCHFGYRDSVFKNAEKGKYIICSVVFKLKKNEDKLNTVYGSIMEELQKRHIDNPTIQDVRNVICDIRSSKLPDITKVGSAGSFFKNPYVDKKQFEILKLDFPNIVAYHENNMVKLAAGWLIEKAGWKGYRKGDAGVYPSQALVLVNYGNTKGEEIIELSKNIQKSVKDLFNVHIEPEVNII